MGKYSEGNYDMHSPQQLMENELLFLEESLQPNNENNRWYTTHVQNYYDKLSLSSGISGVVTSEEYSQLDYKPRDMALIFHACYERSGDDTEKLKERANAAEQWYKHFTGECEISKADFSS